MAKPEVLSRRERQIMDVLYRAGQATAAAVQQSLPQAPSYSAVRALLRILEEKGHVRHKEEAGRYVYTPVVRRDAAKRSAVRHLMDTFFDGSPERMVVSLLDGSAARLSGEELDRIAEIIEQARREEVK